MSYLIMQALFDGRLIPWERRKTHTPERKELEVKIQFEALGRLYNDSAYDKEVEIYSHGFTLGALLMLEIMEKGEYYSVINYS